MSTAENAKPSLFASLPDECLEKIVTHIARGTASPRLDGDCYSFGLLGRATSSVLALALVNRRLHGIVDRVLHRYPRFATVDRFIAWATPATEGERVKRFGLVQQLIVPYPHDRHDIGVITALLATSLPMIGNLKIFDGPIGLGRSASAFGKPSYRGK